MSEQEKQESQKTVVAFAAGLLIGGLLVWIFGGTPKKDEVAEVTVDDTKSTEVTVDEIKKDETKSDTKVDAKPVLVTGEGKIEVDEVKAGNTLALKSATFPTDEGWVGVRDYANGQPAGLLGVARYSKEQGLVPEQIALQRAMVGGNEYAVVFYTESGDRVFSLADDKQIEGTFKTFTAK